MKPMNIKLDDDTYASFENAAKALGLAIPIPQLVEVIINAELAGMNPTKIARKFAKSITNRLSGASQDAGFEDEETT